MSDTDAFSDQEIIAKTAWGEARGEGYEGMQAVINAIQNRFSSGIQWWGTTLRTICLHPYQFSCWLESDPNRSKLLEVTTNDAQYVEAMALAANALAGNLDDLVNGADSYYALSLSKPPGWAKGLVPVAKIGNQLFFKTVKTPIENLQSLA